MATMNPTTFESVFADDDPFTTYEATLQCTGKLVGGAPSDPKLVEGWLTKNLGITDETQLQQYVMRHLMETAGINPADATEAEIAEAIEQNAAEKKAQVFKVTEDGFPYIEGRHVKAMLKEATNIVFPQGTVKWGQYASTAAKTRGQAVGGKSPRSFVAERVFVPEQPIVVGTEISGVELAVGHIKDWKGETRSTLGYFEYVLMPAFNVTVHVFEDCIAPEQWARIWSLAEKNGLGARRSQGAGQFVVTRWEKL